MLTRFHGPTYMNRVFFASLVLVSALSAKSQAGVMVSVSMEINVSGHLLDGATVTFNGTTGDTWSNHVGWSTVGYTSASLTFSAPGTAFDGNTYTPLAGENPWTQSLQASDDQHWLVLTTVGNRPVFFSNGVDTIQFTARFDGPAQDALSGDSVVDADFTDHYFGPTPVMNLMQLTHIAGPNSFGALDASSATVNSSSHSGSNVVPEPASLGIFAMLFGAAALRRRRA